MKKLVILQFDGEFSTGYKVTLEVGVEGKRPDLRIRGELPSAIDVIQCFQNWRDTYRSLYGQTRVKKIGARNVNINALKQKCNERSQNLLNSFNEWLQSQSFKTIINCLSQQDRGWGDEIRVLLSTDCQELRKLPWHLWNGCYAIPYFRFTPFEVALSAPDAERKERPFREKIRILIILGDSTGINVKADEQLLQKYCGDAEIVTLVEPLRQELNNYLQDEMGWDILFFSGHSQTQGTQGRIFLNHDDSLTMAELRDTLLPAIAKRLQLAIFNSCDGLGIARELESLQIPQVIVMREPVPDQVAQEFLKYFLESFTGGSSLCISVGYARKQLQRLEEKFPCASWLPVIVQNQLEIPPTWQSLGITRSPYRGLMAFREEDAENFFGREAFVEQLVIDVTRKPLVAVIGASGSGKSSVVFAGLIPQLRQNNIVGGNCGSDCDRLKGGSLWEHRLPWGEAHRKWQIISFRPGKNPFESLAIALEESKGVAAEFFPSSDAQISGRRQELELEIDLKRDISALQKIIEDILHTPSPTHLLLVVDQFEEVYTLCPDAQERQIFIDGLLKAVNDTPRFTLLITLRADFLGKAMSYQPLGKALQDYPPSLLAPMSREELQRAITQPAARFSVELEEGLVNKLIDDVGSGEGSLPLQQFALTQLWAKQRPGLLTHQAYKEIGGVTQAIANHAEAVYAGLSGEQQKRAQRVFIQLVQPGEGTEDTRRLATRDEVGEDNWDLVTLLASERLVVTNRSELVEDTVEVVHEALIRNWGRLRGWMDDNREFRTWQERLKVALQQWVDSNKDDGGLLRGATLAVAEDWLQQRSEEVSKPQRWFIEKGVGLRERERKQTEKLRQRVIGSLAVGLILALSLGGVAVWGWQEAQLRETNAQLVAGSLSVEKLMASNNELEALVAAVKIGKKLQSSSNIQGDIRLQAVAALQQVVYGIRERNRLQILSNHIKSFDFNGNTIVSGGEDGYITIWNKKGEVVKNFKGHQKSVLSLSLSPDGNIIASGSDNGSLKLWNQNGEELEILKGHRGNIASISFSPDGNTIVSGSNDGSIKLWNKQGQELKNFENHSDGVVSLTFSPDGNTIASINKDGFLKIWDKQGQLVRTIKNKNSFYPSSNSFRNLSFSPDGKAIATIDSGTIKIYSLQGKLIRTLKGNYMDLVHKSLNNPIIPDSGIGQTTIPKSQQIYITAIGMGKGDYSSFSFSPNGKINASSEYDGTIKLWTKDFKEIQSFRGSIGGVLKVYFNHDGNIFAAAGELDKTIKLWNRDFRQLNTLKFSNSNVASISFSPDNNIIAFVINDETIQLWSKNGRKLGTITGHQRRGLILDFSPSIIRFSPNGKTIASGELNGKIKLWTKDGRLLQNFMGHRHSVKSLCFSQDGNIIASADIEGNIKFWGKNGRELHNLKAYHDGVSIIIASPDNNIIVSASLDGTIKLWSRNGKELKKLMHRNGNILSLSFSPDGNTIASGDYDGTVKLWSKNGQELQTLKGHLGTVLSISFSPDSNTIASAGSDGTIKFWSKDGKELYALKGHHSAIKELSFGLDGKTLASSDHDGKIILWNFDLDDLIKKGCDHLHDYLKNNLNVSPEDKHLCDDIFSK